MNAFRGVGWGHGHQPEVDLVLGGQLQRKEHHQRLRICWERILPQRCLRVLLVEDDDSTRQVVSALLRHCGYEVTAVVNDLEAWELLEDPSNHFNLILAEVMVPCLSGIGLLKKIMGHQIYRNIPVIMMSSLDSMSVIFKCLTMGAVDFLIKPVRKNELKNIWKHIWKRRQNLSISVCGSGSDNQDKKSVGLERASGSGNNTYSNEESNNVVGARKFQKGMRLGGRINSGNTCADKLQNAHSDRGNGTQAGNEDLEQSDEYKVDHNHNNASSLNAIKPNRDQFQKEFVCIVETSGDSSDKKIEDCKMGKNVDFSSPREALADPQNLRDKKMVCDQICVKKKDVPSHDHVDMRKANTNLTTFGSECSEPCREAIDLLGSIARKNEGRNTDEETLRKKGENDILRKDETISDSNFSPLLELTLKRQVSISEGSLPENCCVLKPSIASAFSRYNTKCSQFEHPSSSSFTLYTSLPKDYEHTHTLGVPGTQQMMSPHCVLPFEGVNNSKQDDVDVSIPSAEEPQILCRSNNQGVGTTDGFSGKCNIPVMLPIKDEMMPALYAPSHMEMLMPVPIVYSAIPAYYGPAFHAMIFSRPGAPSKFPMKDNGTQRQDNYDISFCNEKQPMPSETPQLSQHGNHHCHYHIEHHHHCCNSHKNQCPNQQAKQDELSLNNSTIIKAPINGLSSIVDNNNTLDGHHGDVGSSGTGSVNNFLSMTKNQTNGQNEAYHHYNHAFEYQSQELQQLKVDKQIVKESRMTALVCSSCNNLHSGSTCNGNEILNVIEHGNNNRINEKNDHGNGQSNATVNPVPNGESGFVNGVTSGSGVDQNRSAQREAALTKFRLKRKERCFEKKVRYQSRKKLAEQRPRVKGQFVRHLIQESSTGNVD